jgi:hypothetical protein
MIQTDRGSEFKTEFGKVLASFRVHVLQSQIRKIEKRRHRTDEEEKELSRKKALSITIGDRDIDCRGEDSIFTRSLRRSLRNCVVAFVTSWPLHTIPTHRHPLSVGTEHSRVPSLLGPHETRMPSRSKRSRTARKQTAKGDPC